jgi:transketolase
MQIFQRKNQLIDVGIAESNLILMSAGVASLGFQTFAVSFANFATLRTLEHLRNLPNRNSSNLKLILSGAGFGASPDWGSTHFMTDDLGALTNLNNLQIYTPADSYEAAAVADSITKSTNFECVRLSVADSRSVHSEPLNTDAKHQLEIGAPLLVFDNVSNFPPAATNNELIDLSATRYTLKPTVVFSYGPIITEAIAAAKLAVPQHHVQVYSCPKLSLNTTAYMSVIRNAAHVITFEEHIKHGGLGTAVAEIIATQQLDVPLSVMGINDPFALPVGDLNYLRKCAGLTAKHLIQTITKGKTFKLNNMLPVQIKNPDALTGENCHKAPPQQI